MAHYLGIGANELRMRVKAELTELQQNPPSDLLQLFSNTPLTIARHISQLAAETEIDADLECGVVSFVLKRPILILSLHRDIGVYLTDRASSAKLALDPIFVFKYPEHSYFEGVTQGDDFKAEADFYNRALIKNTQKVSVAVTGAEATTTIGIFSNAAMVTAEAVTGANTKNTLSMQD